MNIQYVDTESIIRCCGTCRFWVPEETSLEFTILNKRTGMPHCNLNGVIRGACDMKGCLGWKQAEHEELVTRQASGLIE